MDHDALSLSYRDGGAPAEARARAELHSGARDGVVYAPLAEDCELSSKPDCSEALRAAWREANPDGKTRLDELEELVAALLYGGEGE